MGEQHCLAMLKVQSTSLQLRARQLPTPSLAFSPVCIEAKRPCYCMLFDESLNHYLRCKQLDMHVRLWNGSEVKTKYISSEFMGHSSGQDITEKINNLLSEIGIKNLVQISMDGPNFN
ncbi:uncharacterized protein LOC122136544 [Tachysurus ichikawai]